MALAAAFEASIDIVGESAEDAPGQFALAGPEAAAVGIGHPASATP